LPKEKKLEIDNIESLLFTHIIQNPPDEIDELSTHSMIDEVSEINIDEIQILEDIFGGILSPKVLLLCLFLHRRNPFLNSLKKQHL